MGNSCLCLWHHTAKLFKNGKITLYYTELVLERIQLFSDQNSILSILVTIYVAAIVRTTQFISRSNILINAGLLGVRFQVVIPIFFPSFYSGRRNKLRFLVLYVFFLVTRIALWT